MSLSVTHLLHNSRFALREGNVTTRFVLDELDVDLPSLPTGLVIVIFIFIASGVHTLTFDAAVLLRTGPVAGRKVIILDRGRLGGIGDVGHEATGKKEFWRSVGMIKSRR